MDWQITPVWKSGTGTSSDMGLNGQFCASFTLKNPKKVTASGFILTMSSCENLAYFTSISGYSDICNNNYSFRMRGSGISIKGGATVTNLLEFCINVNFGGSNLFQFPNHLDMELIYMTAFRIVIYQITKFIVEMELLKKEKVQLAQ